MAMQFIINETGDHKTLSTIDRTSGVDWTQDMIGNSGAIGQYITYDDEAEAYRISADDYDWWADYIDKAEADADERQALESAYGTDAVQKIYEDEWRIDGNDYDDHHAINQRAAERVRDELTPVA